MNTIILRTNSYENILKAVSILRNGGIIATPTDTIYGLVASIFNKEAVEKIYSVKKRPNNKPLIVLISDINQFKDLTINTNKYTKILIEKFWPGPLTLVLKKSSSVPGYVTSYKNFVGIRFPKSNTIKQIIDNLGVPIVAPSANISGKPNPSCFDDVFKDFNCKVDAILKDEINVKENAKHRTESTIVSLKTDIPKILREGAIPKEEIEKVLSLDNF